MPHNDRRPTALLQPYQMGDLHLANRIVMAPLTRSRATNPDLLPTDLHVDYYAQRASAGLIITEGTWISRDAVGWHDVPGIFTDAQVTAWSAVTNAVHDNGGVIFTQLWHTGSTSHPNFFSGTPPLAPSAVNPGLSSPTSLVSSPTETGLYLHAVEAGARRVSGGGRKIVDGGSDVVEGHCAWCDRRRGRRSRSRLVVRPRVPARPGSHSSGHVAADHPGEPGLSAESQRGADLTDRG